MTAVQILCITAFGALAAAVWLGLSFAAEDVTAEITTEEEEIQP